MRENKIILVTASLVAMFSSCFLLPLLQHRDSTSDNQRDSRTQMTRSVPSWLEKPFS